MSQMSRLFGYVMALLGFVVALSGLALAGGNGNLQSLLVGLGCGVAGIGLAAVMDTVFGPTSQLLTKLDRLETTTRDLSGLEADLADSNRRLSDTVGTVNGQVRDLTATVEGLESRIPLLNRAEELGIRFFYRSREDTETVDVLLDRYFPDQPAEVAKSREVVIVGSTIRGLYQNGGIRDRVQAVMVDHKAPYRFLLRACSRKHVCTGRASGIGQEVELQRF